MLSVVITILAAAAPLVQARSVIGPIDIEMPGVPKFCSLEPDVGPCDGSFPRWYFRKGQGCFKFDYGGCGGNDNRFDSEKECKKVCAGLNLPPCKQPIIPGPCKGSFPRWAFDKSKGKCVKFIYGGCGGNDNNYKTEEECSEACGVTLVPVCKQQPGVVGPCEALVPRYTFNQKTKQCEKFTWGGCDGNQNNFETLKECQKTCDVSIVNPCKLPIVTGPCRAYIPSWGFDKKLGKCRKFVYGGCKGNENRFKTQEECEKKCPPVKPVDPCNLPIVPGPCKASIPSWGFDKKLGKCRKFIYGGCKGNANRFSSEKECAKTCPPTQVDRCSLPIVPGPCKAYFPSWAFDTKLGKCRKFVYGGCKGNKNRFSSRKDCEKACGKPKPDPNEICNLPIYPPEQKFFCLAAIPRWTYNGKKGACEKFIYGGCGGTANIFETEKECLETCRGVGDVIVKSD